MQTRRTVVVQTRAVLGANQRGVRARVRPGLQDGVADVELLPRGPLRSRCERVALQRDLLRPALVHDQHGTARGDPDRGPGPLGVQSKNGLCGVTEHVVTRVETQHDTGTVTRDHTDLHDPRWVRALTDGTAYPDDSSVDQSGIGYRGLRVDPVLPRVQRDLFARRPGDEPDQRVEHMAELSDGRARVGVHDHFEPWHGLGVDREFPAGGRGR